MGNESLLLPVQDGDTLMDINEYVKNWKKKAAHLRPSEDELNSIGLQKKVSSTQPDTLVVGPHLAKK
eukprot:90668-Rhodomonas_salina.1